MIATCSMDTRVCVIDVDKRQVAHTIKGHSKGVRSLDWSKVYKIVGT